jgi:hypothetical protein
LSLADSFVVADHLPDEFPQFLWERWAPAAAGFPAPEETKGVAVPAGQRSLLHMDDI